ncbi:MAG: 6-phosphofructokinase [Gemmatimonadetes bacterium]|nr:MAG: 6-phosphofructokinase [Gemmatimonadetes bacterium 13_1_40CM_4_69_5]OLC95609.1 MAG: 6-phosphofructokinase [Gemmatimonadetes bacterium 13_1_40CM_3_70_6]OLD43514.1 MAG: 6-phosphofructokinase [Gemmatimonadetes bacterium 13_1_40CM_2_70_7]OLE60965.1 MAG: 6-phosphofructokinase [Gemmatimonadetes bacterium 13_1_20CM_2_70_10]PYO36612.1 MAG: 6-phosphofructokinase [Gemmatimonadota bacterium]
MKIAISTGGGDAPGLNAVIRGAVLAAVHRGWECVGIRKGYDGLLGQEQLVPLGPAEVRGITHLGGTILGTTNRGDPFHWRERLPDGTWVEHDRSEELVRAFRAHGIGALIAIGGDGSLRIARHLLDKGVALVGVPKTIDNDVGGTEATFGFDTAVQTATEAIDKLHSTAESHERVMVVEVMGRHAGFIALSAGLAGSADVILIPEIPYEMDRVCNKIRQREAEGRHFSMVVVAEGAVARGGEEVYLDAERRRLGGVGDRVARVIEQKTGKETRTLVLGHLQRGGSPTTFDRLLGLRFGAAAVRLIAEGKFGHMVALDPPTIVSVPLDEALAAPKRVPLDSDSIATARDLGISLGD